MLKDFPVLHFPEKNRPYEYNKYSSIQRAEIIYKYLFEGVSTRSLDSNVLDINSNISKGFESHGILRHCGISGSPVKGHKGRLNGLPLELIINAMNQNANYFYKILYHLKVYQVFQEKRNVSSPPEIVWEKSTDYTTRKPLLTEKEYLRIQRIGQDLFRHSLLSIYYSCALCSLSQQELLIASHIKPWNCSNDWERLDQFNGLVLCPNHDKLFDKGFITFDKEGIVIASRKLNKSTVDYFQLDVVSNIYINDNQVDYFKWHREYVFD